VIMKDYLLSNGFLEAKTRRRWQMVKGKIDPALLETWFACGRISAGGVRRGGQGLRIDTAMSARGWV